MKFLAAFIFLISFWGSDHLFAQICSVANSSPCDYKSVSEQEQCLSNLKKKLFDCRITFGQLNANTIEPNKEKIFQDLKKKMEAAQGSINQTDEALTADAEAVAKVLADFDSYLLVIRSNYISLMKNFVQIYRTSEEAVETEISTLAKAQESSDRATIIRAIVRLQEIRSSEADLALTYRSQANLLKSNVESLSSLIQSRLKGKTAYLESHGWGDLLNPLVNLKAPLESVLAYISTRENYVSGKLSQALNQLDLRLKTVQKLEIDAEIGPTLKEAAYLTSVNNFMGEVEAARLLAFQEGPKHPRLNIAYYGSQYQNLKKFLDYGKICLNSSKPKWTESGCLRFNQYQAQASRIYKGTIASFLRQNLNAIEATYPNLLSERVKYVRGLIEKKSYGEAVTLHDSLLSSEAFK
ncbi:MAG TPA: hypothetical protein VE954_31460 [Oligoflexus sp.]|uniref:hypothetical protein n=1 Tax=Oligoflexus sp. TaxID=1971216 RepID=UPI002D282F2B|nr:hypothetical protein [Oligoflexus sp.]HYX37643.1 hypothetical protein [Oligoflexus sp.]